MNYTYSEFKQHILSGLKERLAPGTTFTLQDIIKNNDTHLDGLTILSPGANIGPTIYLNYYFEQYLETGRSLPETVDDILKSCGDSPDPSSVDISFFTDYDKAKSRIVFKLVNYERNRTLLSDVPHFRFLDLALVFQCLAEVTPTGSASILIHNRHLPYWGITKDDLYALAQQNTPKLLSYEFLNMKDVIQELFSAPDAGQPSDTAAGFPMYVLTNHCRLNGSVCMLYENLLEAIAGRLDADLVIIPSSIHEVLILPSGIPKDIDALSGVIQEVNSSQLSREEILSDHAYYFSRETGKITM